MNFEENPELQSDSERSDSKGLALNSQSSPQSNQGGELFSSAENSEIELLKKHIFQEGLLFSNKRDQLPALIAKVDARTARFIRDIDTWHGDQPLINELDEWIGIYGQQQDASALEEFILEDTFHLFLRGRVSIRHIDPEFPQYPDHDNFFVTEDLSFIIEYPESFSYVQELKRILTAFFGHHGVDKAQFLIRQLMEESYTFLEENSYQRKKTRLENHGIWDSFDLTPYLGLTSEPKREAYYRKRIANFRSAIERRKKVDQKPVNKVQTNHALRSNDSAQKIESELLDLEFQSDFATLELRRAHEIEKRISQFLSSLLVRENQLKNPEFKTETFKKQARAFVDLGIEYCRSQIQIKDKDLIGQNLFEVFDLVDFYAFGLGFKKSIDLKVASVLARLERTGVESGFLGEAWSFPIDDLSSGGLLFDRKGKMRPVRFSDREITELNLESVEFVISRFRLLEKMVPLIQEIHQTYEEVRLSLSDDFYCNYGLEDIDFQVLLQTSFVSSEIQEKLGVDVKSRFSVHSSDLLKVLPLLREYEGTKKSYQSFLESIGLSLGPVDMSFLSNALLEDLDSIDMDAIELETKSSDLEKYISGVLLLSRDLN